MLSGVSIVCFAASYAVALGLEITRLLFRSGIRGILMIGFAAAGLFAHTVYLAHLATGVSGLPLSSMRDWYLLAAWVLAAIYLYLSVYHSKTPFGLFVLPLVLGLVGVARFFADTTPFPREPASRIWGTIHAASILLATVAVLVGFAAGLMYLSQTRRLKRKLAPPRGLRLPSLEWLQRANSRALVISSAMLGLGILSGVILNVIQDASRLDQLPWNDPFILSTVGMFGWLVVSTGVSLFYRPAREGRRVACLTVVSFLFLLLALSAGLFLKTRHLGARMEGERRTVRDSRREAEEGGRIAYCRLQIANCELQIADCRLGRAEYELRVADCRRQAVGCGWERENWVCGPARRGSDPADCHRRASSFPRPPSSSPLLTACCPLPTAYGLLPTAYYLLRGLSP